MIQSLVGLACFVLVWFVLFVWLIRVRNCYCGYLDGCMGLLSVVNVQLEFKIRIRMVLKLILVNGRASSSWGFLFGLVSMIMTILNWGCVIQIGPVWVAIVHTKQTVVAVAHRPRRTVARGWFGLVAN